MKSFFKFVLIFFALAFTLLLDSSALQAQPISSSAFISSPQKESVVLVSNNLWQGEIRSAQDETQENFIGAISAIVAEIQPEIFFIKNKTLLKGCFIHNLSTDKQKVHQIRAP